MSPKLWPWVPALLLGSLLGTQLVVLSRVLDDPSFAVENDYYQKALHWDAERTRVERSHALGWTATGEAHAASGGQALLVIALRDGHGAALSGAELELLAFHNARAAAPLSLHATEVRPGEYQTELDHPRPGRWEVRVHALRGKETYDEVLRLDVAPTGPRT